MGTTNDSMTNPSGKNKWSLRWQMAVAAALATLLLSASSWFIIVSTETRFYLQQLESQIKLSVDTLESSIIEAVIAEDSALLNSIQQQLVSHTDAINTLTITNEDDVVLLSWQSTNSTDHKNAHHYTRHINYAGELFGKLTIILDHDKHSQEIKTHARNASLITLALLSILSLINIGAVRILALRPLKVINNRLLHHAHGSGAATLPNYASREFQELNKTVDLLEKLTTSRKKLQEEIEQRKLAQQESARARDEALLASQHKSQFLASMSHELRTPLNAIIGYSEIMLEDNKVLISDSLVDDVYKIHRSGNLLLQLINNLLDLSKIEAGRMETNYQSTPLLPILHEVVENVQYIMNKNNNRLETHYNLSNDTIETDATKLKQILLNLLSNAGKFTKNGTISFRVDLGNHTRDRITFCIEDNGIGMDKRQLQEIFKPYTQADRHTADRFGGTGLGLAVALRLANLLNGRIDVTSSTGKGSTFTLVLRL